MRIVINAQLDPGSSGGIAQVLLGLAHGLGRLSGAEEYVFVCSPQSEAWLRPHVGKNGRIKVNGRTGDSSRASTSLRLGARQSDGFFESFKPDVIHFPYQAYTVTGIPSVFNPHDLQHVYLPEFFSDNERERRDALYSESCRHAAAIVVASQFVKRDIVTHYGVRPDRVHVVGWGAPTQAYRKPDTSMLDAARTSQSLPENFAIYPAQLWPHKNHKRLLEALSRLRDDASVNLHLVCTGAETKFQQEIESAIHRLGLADQVWLTGRVDEDILMALYGLAQFMVVPTLFEAISFPILEAFAEGIPVACSNIGALPEQVDDAALLFDPYDVEQMAGAMLRLHRDNGTRDELIRRGRRRLADFTWEETAQRYRDVYREAASRVKLRASGATVEPPSLA